MLLGLILAFAIGTIFYTLGKAHNENKWLYAVIGILSYSGSSFLGVLLLGFLFSQTGMIDVESVLKSVLVFLSFPIGLLGCWLTYFFLYRRLTERPNQMQTDLLDEDI